MSEQSGLKLSPHQVREVAVKARCHPRTVLRWLRGDAVQAISGDRIVAALKVLGHEVEAS
jgi:hypothetical protein